MLAPAMDSAASPALDARRAEPLWRPSRPGSSNLRAFCDALEDQGKGPFGDFTDLHGFSVSDPPAFWSAVWDFCEVIAGSRGERVFVPGAEIFNGRFFPDARLNFAENLLRRADGSPALIYSGESGDRRALSWAELRSDVARLAGALGDVGLRPGDRVAAWLPNIPETCELMLATAALGGVFSSCSPDFGVDGVLDRFGQIRPRVLVAADGYRYGARSSTAWSAWERSPPRCPASSGSWSCRSWMRLPTCAASRMRCPGKPSWPRIPPAVPQGWSSPPCPSITRSTCCTPRAPRACPSPSSTGRAASC